MSELAEVKQDAMIALVEKVALDPSVDTGKMQQIIDMQAQVFDKNAQIEFNRAMTACQKEMPIIQADQVNKQTNSLYAAYEGLIKKIKRIYTKHGFSLSFDEGKSSKEGHIMVMCEVMHEGGHTKMKSGEFPLDQAGIKGVVNKTGIHATASTLSYAKRYLVKGIFNLAEGDEDDDAISAGGATYSDLLEFINCLRENWFSMAVMKQALFDNDLDIAAEAWHELTQDQKDILRRGSTRGGVITAEEAKKIKEDPNKRFVTRIEAE